MFFIYILYSESSDKYYIGYTENVEKRFYFHFSLNSIWRL